MQDVQSCEILWWRCFENVRGGLDTALRFNAMKTHNINEFPPSENIKSFGTLIAFPGGTIRSYWAY
jgi:hypothetical protein